MLCQTCANPCKYGYQFDCPNYKSKDVGKQTNEEWLRTLPTTEELAKAIMECAIAKSWMFNEQSILRWLKEKHE